MVQKFQPTNLHRNTDLLLEQLDLWSINPWRRYSLFLIVLLTGFLLGSSIGMINGVLALMDPVGAFFTVVLLEAMVRVRRHWPKKAGAKIVIDLVDMSRIGLLYGLLLEGFKLL